LDVFFFVFVLKVQLNSDQEHERNSLKTILDEDQHNLLSLQEESRLRMEQQHSDERRQLERNIEDRLRKLNEQVFFNCLKSSTSYEFIAINTRISNRNFLILRTRGDI